MTHKRHSGRCGLWMVRIDWATGARGIRRALGVRNEAASAGFSCEYSPWEQHRSPRRTPGARALCDACVVDCRRRHDIHGRRRISQLESHVESARCCGADLRLDCAAGPARTALGRDRIARLQLQPKWLQPRRAPESAPRFSIGRPPDSLSRFSAPSASGSWPYLVFWRSCWSSSWRLGCPTAPERSALPSYFGAPSYRWRLRRSSL